MRDLFENDEEHAGVMAKTGFWGKRGAGCIFYGSGKFMLLLRSSLVREPNTWGCCGGAVDSGETLLQACAREVKEEAGYTGKIKFVKFYTFKREGFEYTNFVGIVPKAFTPVLNWESTSHAWVNFGEWPAPLHPGLKEAFADSEAQMTLKEIVDG